MSQTMKNSSKTPLNCLQNFIKMTQNILETSYDHVSSQPQT